jgi:hypothetical protein
VLWLAGACLPACSAAGPSNKADCATCHKSEALSQRGTLMALALELPGANPILKMHPKLTFQRGAFTYTVTTQGTQTTYSITDGTHIISLPILWGFGAGAQTWLLSMDGKFYESLVSYFPSLDGLGITIGDETSTPHNIVEAMGRELGEQEVKSCFGCHTTGAIVNDKLDLTAFKPGVTCEHCHLGAAAHMADATRKNFTSTPPSLGDLSAEDLSNFCGQCHRTWSTVVLQRSFGENNVRFSPYRLALSKCFNGTDARISCVACHNPHVNVSTRPASYDAKCLACHAALVRTDSAAHPQAKACPIAKSNCVSCHMPKVARAGGHITFTDHFIRVVKPGEPYPD